MHRSITISVALMIITVFVGWYALSFSSTPETAKGFWSPTQENLIVFFLQNNQPHMAAGILTEVVNNDMSTAGAIYDRLANMAQTGTISPDIFNSMTDIFADNVADYMLDLVLATEGAESVINLFSDIRDNFSESLADSILNSLDNLEDLGGGFLSELLRNPIENLVGGFLSENPFGGLITWTRYCEYSRNTLINVNPPPSSTFLPRRLSLRTGPFGADVYLHRIFNPGIWLLGTWQGWEPCIIRTASGRPRIRGFGAVIRMVGTSGGSVNIQIPQPTTPIPEVEPPEEPPDPDQPRVTLSADPQNINEGESSTLNWESENTSSCWSVDDEFNTNNSTAGQDVVEPQETTTYTIECEGEDGTASDSVTVTVGLTRGCEGLPRLEEFPGVNVAHYASGISRPGRTDRARAEVGQAIGRVQEELRTRHGIETHITSACTPPNVPNPPRNPNSGSRHFDGLAVDFQPVDGDLRNSETLNLLLQTCYDHGFHWGYTGATITHCDMKRYCNEDTYCRP